MINYLVIMTSHQNVVKSKDFYVTSKKKAILNCNEKNKKFAKKPRSKINP